MPDRTLLLIGAGAAVVFAAIGYYSIKKLSATLPAGAFNPLSRDNVVYQGVNNVGAVLSGDPEFSLGVKIYDVLHPAESSVQWSGSAPPAMPAPTEWESRVFTGMP